MEDVITTLVFIAIAIFSIVGKVRSKQTAGKKTNASKQDPLALRIEKFFARIQEKIETNTGQRPSPPETWQALLDDDADYILEEPPIDGIADDLAPDDVDEPGAGLVPSAVKIEVVPPPEKRRQRHCRRQYACSRSDLRRAVVWSEIIGPPVALRDKHLHR